MYCTTDEDAHQIERQVTFITRCGFPMKYGNQTNTDRKQRNDCGYNRHFSLNHKSIGTAFLNVFFLLLCSR